MVGESDYCGKGGNEWGGGEGLGVWRSGWVGVEGVVETCSG